jgi:SAM-dependent methyltransferase
MRCRACDGVLAMVIDFGAHPVGGWFPRADDALGARLPLRLGACESCGLAQLVDPSPPETDEPDAPSPLSSTTMSGHARGFVDDLIARGLATESSRILSIASHGGHLAPFLAERGLSALVLEGSPGRAARLSRGGARVVAGELDGTVPPAGLEAGSVDLVVDSYLLAHLEHPRLALLRLRELLAPGGTLVMEFDHLLATVEGCQWDAVRHGHHAYLSLTWLARELAQLGLGVVDAAAQPVYGGALRLYASAGPGLAGPAVRDLLARESAAAIDQPHGLAPLATAVDRARQEVVAHLRAARAAGRTVVGYGAPARSITFLNALGIGPDLLPYVVDRATAKQGGTIPGVRIPIRAPQVLADDVPDEILILTWDLAAEVRESLAIPVLADTRFMVAVPRLHDVTDRDAGSKRTPSERPVR